MQRPLPEYVQISWCQKVVLLCLLVVAHPGTAQANSGSSLIDPFEDSPTMGSSVPQQNLLWQSTVKGYLADPAFRSKPAEAQPRANFRKYQSIKTCGAARKTIGSTSISLAVS